MIRLQYNFELLLCLLAFNVCLLECVNIQFADPEGAFLLKPYSDSTTSAIRSPYTTNVVNNYTFVVMKDGHLGNKVIVTDSGFTAEANLETLLTPNYSNSASALSVQVLNTKIGKEQPGVRVFVYHRYYTNAGDVGTRNGNARNNSDINASFRGHYLKRRKSTKISTPCVTVYAVYKNRAVFGQCRPNLFDHGVCVVDLVVPLLWWPRLASVGTEIPPPKRPKTFVKIAYTVLVDEDQPSTCHNDPVLMKPKPLDTLLGEKSALTTVQEVELIGQTKYVSLPFDKILNILVPNKEFHPGDIFTTSIFYRYNPIHGEQPPYLFQMRCHAAQGIKILGTEEIVESGWTAPSEMNYKLSTLTITAFYGGQFNTNESWSGEIITLVLQVSPEAKSEGSVSGNESANVVQKPTLLSSISYMIEGKSETSSSELITDRSSDANLTKPLNVQTTFNIEKDAVQALVPIGKFDFTNTAVLTGKQVSVGLKIFSLSHAGAVSDVTLQSQCIALEPAVLKVTPRCTSVYVDGSESRGDMNASIAINFGNYKGWASYKVWYPEFPVDIWIADPVLHAIKSWKILDKPSSRWIRKKRQPADDIMDRPKSYSKCRLRYQESLVKVYARFRVDDLTTGGRSYLGGRKLQMDITYLSRSHLKVNDGKIAQMKFVDGVVLVQGLYPGRTELQLVSPYSRIPFGAGQIEVTNEQLNIRNLRAQSLAGISLSILPDLNAPDIFTVVVRRSKVFTRKYQDGRLNVAVEYSNDFLFPLELMDMSDYHLDVAIRDSSLVLKGNNKGAGLPTFLTVEETKGNVLYLSLFPSPPCQQNTDGPLISSTAIVEAHFPALSDQQRAKSAEVNLLSPFIDISPVEPQNIVAKPGTPNLDFPNYARYPDPKVQQGPSSGQLLNDKSGGTKSVTPHQAAALTPAEVAVYIFLAVFLLMGSIFALHCLASTSRRAKWKYAVPNWLRFNGFRRQPVTSAGREFVWVGPEELSHCRELQGTASLNSKCSRSLLQKRVNGRRENDEESLEEDEDWRMDDNRDCEETWLPCYSDDDEPPPKYTSFSSYNATFPGSVAEQSAAAAAARQCGNPAGNNRISYLGSEVSIHMCPKPLMEVHGGRRAASWNHRSANGNAQTDAAPCPYRVDHCGARRYRHSDGRRRQTAGNNGRRVRITSNPIGDSSSEQNLSSYCAAASSPPPWTAHSAADLHWDSTSLGMDELQLRDYFNSLRESMA